jgi:hypothetical protein
MDQFGVMIFMIFITCRQHRRILPRDGMERIGWKNRFDPDFELILNPEPPRRPIG